MIKIKENFNRKELSLIRKEVKKWSRNEKTLNSSISFLKLHMPNHTKEMIRQKFNRILSTSFCAGRARL